VFELVNHGGGAYTPVTLLSFNGTNGRCAPFCTLARLPSDEIAANTFDRRSVAARDFEPSPNPDGTAVAHTVEIPLRSPVA